MLARHPSLQLLIQTDDRRLAEEWLTLVCSVEGVVAKRADGRYSASRQRDWLKVKRQRTAYCVVIEVVGDAESLKLVLGLRHADRAIHHFGVSRPLPPTQRGTALELLAESGPEERPIRSRWGHDAVPPWRPVPPVRVCEVGYYLLDGGRWLRQPAAFLRVDRHED